MQVSPNDFCVKFWYILYFISFGPNIINTASRLTEQHVDQNCKKTFKVELSTDILYHQKGTWGGWICVASIYIQFIEKYLFLKQNHRIQVRVESKMMSVVGTSKMSLLGYTFLLEMRHVKLYLNGLAYSANFQPI